MPLDGTLDIPSHMLPTKLQRGEGYAIGERVLRVPHGHKPEHIVHPDYWQHLGQVLKVDTRIEALAEDGSFDAELRVVQIGPGGRWVKMRVLRICDGDGSPILIGQPAALASADEKTDADGYKVEFARARKWRITRAGDVIDDMLPTREAAHARLAEIKAERKAA